MAIKQLELKDIIPPKPFFFVKSKQKSYHLRLPTLEDQVWLNEKFGGPEGIQKVLNTRDWPGVCRMVYRHMSNEGREDFLAQAVKIINDEGESVLRRMTGPEVLFCQLSGVDEAVKMLGAMIRAIMSSNPLIEKEVLEEIKKNLRPDNHSLSQSPSIGEKSSTRSRANTGGRKSK